MKLLLPFLTALGLTAFSASAQTTFRLGLRGGLNRALTTQAAAANYSVQTSYYTVTYTAAKSAIYAWQAGAVAEVSFGKISLQPALLFSQKGETAFNATHSQATTGYYYDHAEQTSTNRYNWLELPLNVVYTAHGDHGWQLFAGPYVAFAVGGHQKGTGNSTSSGVAGPYSYPIDQRIRYGDGTAAQRLDAGVNFGIGYRQGPVQVQVGYGLGLRNLYQASQPLIDPYSSPAYHNSSDDTAYNRVAQLTGTYFFSL